MRVVLSRHLGEHVERAGTGDAQLADDESA